MPIAMQLQIAALAKQAGVGPRASPPMAASLLEPHIRALGEWAHRNIDCEVSLKDLDARLLMWKIRGKIDLLELPKRKRVIQFILTDPPNETANYWLMARTLTKWLMRSSLAAIEKRRPAAEEERLGSRGARPKHWRGPCGSERMSCRAVSGYRRGAQRGQEGRTEGSQEFPG